MPENTTKTTATGSSSTVIPGAAGLPAIEIPSAIDIYDAIMGDIELELVSVAIPHLQEKYKDETQEERKARMERYQKAYTEFHKRYTEWITEMKKLFNDYKRKALQLAEQKTKEKEEQELANFDAQFDAVS